MPIAAVATLAMPEAKERNSLRLSFVDRQESLTEWRLSLLDRRESTPECVTRRKSADNLRKRNSWRWSWKNVLTRPFQGQNATRLRSFREKRKIRKKMSSESCGQVSKNPVETRRKMDELLRMWHTEIVDSSDDSSDDDDDSLLRGRERSCSPRVIGDESSSSEDGESESMEEVLPEVPVSLYASQGPTRMVISEHLEENGNPERDADFHEADPTVERVRTSRDVRQSFLLSGAEHEQGTGRANSDLKAMTGHQEMVHHAPNNSVISPLQIYDLERCSENPGRREHFCSINCECGAGCGNGADRAQQQIKPGKVINGIKKCDYVVRGEREDGGFFKKAEISDVESLESDHLWNTHLQGTIERDRNDALSVLLQNKHSELGRDELINESHNEDSLAQTSAQTEARSGDQLCRATKMEELFSSQELNAIRRFLGMSLLQIDRNKVAEKAGTEHSKDVLPDYPSTYPKSNGETKGQMTSPHEKDSSELECEFKTFGCTFPETRSVLDLENHIKSNVGEHLKLVSKTAAEQREQLRDQRELQEKQGHLIKQLTETVRNLKDLVQDQMKKNQTQEKVMVSLKDQLKEQRKQSQRFERDMSQQFQTLSQSPPATLPALPTIPGTAEMLWPVRNFTKRSQRVRDGEIDDPLISEPFYTGPYGYKVSIWLYLNGRGKSHGSCVSVYARIMPGEHDAVLSWPVRPVYTFTVFDQSEGQKQNIVRTRRVGDIQRHGGKHRHGIERPSGGDRSVIVGFDDFIAHEQLEKRNYLANDCLFVKLEAKLLH